MNFVSEVHLTVEHKDDIANNNFIELCKKNSIKAFVVKNGIDEVSRHLMTSCVCRNSFDMTETVLKIREIAKQLDIKIIRNKIEVPAFRDKFEYVNGETYSYYEAHVEVVTDDIRGVPFDTALWSVSSRLDKPSEHLLTMRARNTTLSNFKNKCNDSTKGFADFIKKDAIQFERCIADDNVELDADWLVNY